MYPILFHARHPVSVVTFGPALLAIFTQFHFLCSLLDESFYANGRNQLDGSVALVRRQDPGRISFPSSSIRLRTQRLCLSRAGQAAFRPLNTLETIEWPESRVDWIWSVGSADLDIERAILRFFQTDVGQGALSADVAEFKLCSAPLCLSSNQIEHRLCPTGYTPAIAPLQSCEEVVMASESASLPHSHICTAAVTGGWLQVSPHTHLAQLPVIKPQDERTSKSRRYSRSNYPC